MPAKSSYKNYKKNDPYRARELEKYADPIPSREYIMQCLDEYGKPLPCEKVIALFGLKQPEMQEAMRRRLIAMERQGQLIRNRRGKYALVDQLELIRGHVMGHKEGFGFLIPDDGSGDLFITPYQMRSLMPDDVVLARAVEKSNGKREAVIVEVLERTTTQIVGRYMCENHVAFVQPHHKKITQDIMISPGEENGAGHGQYVIVELLTYPTVRRQATGKVVQILGDYLSPGMEIEVAIHSHGIPNIWSKEVKQQIKKFKSEVLEADKKNRKDIRDLPLVTIDGADAKDFDDAVYCEVKTDKSFRLLVAIADVSHYVLPETALDKEACKRGNSVYFPGRVVPMLPEILSNELCSLKPQVDRLCMVCDMHISEAGELLSAEFYDAVMRSRARLIYDDVAAMLAGKKKSQMALLPHLENLQQIYQKMLQQRQKRGALDFDTVETRIVFGKNQKIKEIVPVVRNEAHRLIEECMLMANVATAEFLLKNNIPILYRVHQGPNPDKIENLQGFLKSFGLRLALGEKATPQDYQKLLQAIESRPDAHLIETVLLRSLMQAVYSPDNAGHFGLAYEAYTHFTSPIRRYPDLLVHRGIRHLLNTKKSKKAFLYSHQDMAQLGEHCSQTERRADEATRDAVNWLKCYYMKDKLGEEFDGIITGVTAFGIFVELKNIYVEGLVHISALRDDYYSYEPVQHLLKGKRTGTIYRLGDAIRVRVVRVNPDERELDFELVEPIQKPEPAAKKRRKTKRT